MRMLDAYGDYEQHTGFMTALGDELVFPFKAKVMGKTPRAKSLTTDWIKLLAADAIDAAWNEAVVDAYDDDEQLTGTINAIQNELAFPFPVKVMGLDVLVLTLPTFFCSC